VKNDRGPGSRPASPFAPVCFSLPVLESPPLSAPGRARVRSIGDFYSAAIPIPACGSCPGGSRISKPDPGFRISIAMTIAIKNRSGKIAGRFSDRNRSAISGSKSILDFHVKIDQRLKNSFWTISTDGTQNRILIFVQKSISDFDLKIDQRFTF
jgi:hypothetical protein